MKFWIVENNSMDWHAKYLEMDFPEITEEMFENDEHIDILHDKLKELDLDSFSSHYEFDEQREKYYATEEENLRLRLEEATILLSSCLPFITGTELGKDVEKFLEDDIN